MESHLLQMRGLKPKLRGLTNGKIQSHLLQMRGLKPGSANIRRHDNSRIFYRCVD